MSGKRTLGDLSSIIGEVSNKNKDGIAKVANETNFNGIQVQNNLSTSAFNIPDVKVPESFKISPSLKYTVEEIVEKLRKQGVRTSKGKVYNHLIAKGLETIK